MPSGIASLRSLLIAIVCGILASLGTATISNETGIGLPETSHYGYPLPWLVSNLNGPTDYILANLALDTAFWIAILLVTLIFLQKIAFPNLGIHISRKSILLPTILFIPLGLVMAFAHESGHAMLGTAVGGTLTYMKIAYLEIYPRLALTQQFQLGLTGIHGLTYGSTAYGLMVLGGSMTTNTASWILALILLKISLDVKIQVVLKLLGVFGILDLPFYVVFPQLGLTHWVFLGGSEPEPLNGARMLGLPDPAFYLMVALSTLGLLLLYSQTLRANVSTKIRALLQMRSSSQ
jgi:hypothetical protein